MVPTGEMPRAVSLSCERYLVDKVMHQFIHPCA